MTTHPHHPHKHEINFSVARLISTAGVIVAILAVLGYVYTVGQAVSDVRGRLDRNCRLLVTIQANTRFLIIERTEKNKQLAQDFREIFQRTSGDHC